MDNVFVVGDVHGNLDRLEALLKQEGLLAWCDKCQGGGELRSVLVNKTDYSGSNIECPDCKGLGWARTRPDVTIVQLGDLGHFGAGGSPTGDLLCYKYVTENRWCDIVLWGNHDRAMVDRNHAFAGFVPDYQTGHYVAMLHDEGRLMMALEAHGFLLTHAGLALSFKHQKVSDELKTDPAKFADWINDEDEKLLQDSESADPQAVAIINAIGRQRGGSVDVGGVLWRDIEENLYDDFRQIFGHSADHREHQVRACWKNGNMQLHDLDNIAWIKKGSYCIDIGGKSGYSQADNCLASIWLPSEKIVEVRL